MKYYFNKLITIRLIVLSFVLFSVCNVSCKKELKVKTTIENKEESEATSQPPPTEHREVSGTKVNIEALETSFRRWWAYHSENISISSNFIGVDQNFKEIDSKSFVDKLASGEFIPIKLKTIDGTDWYQLHQLSKSADQDIGKTIKNEALDHLKKFSMESSMFPLFDFTDLNGERYTNKSTEGKILIVKTWFINCVACVAEFNELNEFVEKNKNRKDIIFISLATDPEEDLEKFLEKKPFSYKVVPNQKQFIKNKLKTKLYPTHIVVNKNGTIGLVANKASEMISYVERNQ